MDNLESETDCRSYIAFVGHQRLAEGDRQVIALAMHAHVQLEDSRDVQVFDLESGLPVQLDASGSEAELRARYPRKTAMGSVDATPSRSTGRSRPKAVAGTVTLLPRHWEWLESQPSGVSAALRRAVDGARKASVMHDRARHAQDRTYRFLSSLAGDLPGFEETVRALYAADRTAFDTITARWPTDIAATATRISRDAFLPSDP